MPASNYINAYLCSKKCGKKTEKKRSFKNLEFLPLSNAAGGIATKLGVDFDGLSALLGKTKSVLTQISR